ncbi:MAG TPA: hypothetical protein VF593_09955 [Chthoniobacteraceae bacterium]|jgi:hypothetical protein
MAWFQLQAEQIAARVRGEESASRVPSLAESIWRGVLGFTLLSVAGFVPWALSGRWFYRAIGEAGLYAVCALVFIGLSGPLLHRLMIGPGSLSRFYRLFAIAFTAYSVLWIAGWMAFGGHLGSIVGLGLGTAAMAFILVTAFGSGREWLKVFAALFILNTLGYFVGGWVEGAVAASAEWRFGDVVVTRKTLRTTAHLLWGVFYGLGFGAGLGLAFHFCQTNARALIRGRDLRS